MTAVTAIKYFTYIASMPVKSILRITVPKAHGKPRCCLAQLWLIRRKCRFAKHGLKERETKATKREVVN